MEPRESQVESIFFAALEKPTPGERGVFVADACGEDDELQQRVERLLNAHPQLGRFLDDDSPAFANTVTPTLTTERPGDTIGPYKLREEIGEGGFGGVYLAEQTEPIKRRVALKIIKPGMDTREVIARFEAERQALSIMEHPNIARVFDAGATDSGRPYSSGIWAGLPSCPWNSGNVRSRRWRVASMLWAGTFSWEAVARVFCIFWIMRRASSWRLAAGEKVICC